MRSVICVLLLAATSDARLLARPSSARPAVSAFAVPEGLQLSPEMVSSGGVSSVLGFCSGKATKAVGDAAALGL